eukprot:TRINITY_DN5872_c0_g2_i1.p1 TRINITY_DN5872_c0_g2~~TRINITY_DN5872_c0_g2_i1.p1  ORF type:complete len:198 (-),score=40.61 TRINITY_DN5872_c0_g2_i1:250-843(-)
MRLSFLLTRVLLLRSLSTACVSTVPKSSFMSLETASFGAGCFWGTEKFFKKEFPKLKEVAVGYQGGAAENPDYKAVCTGTTGHAEVLQVKYDPADVKFEDLCYFFFRMHDPTTKDRQQGDVGSQYRSAIFYTTDEQKTIAEKVIADVGANAAFKKAYGGRSIVTQVAKASTFYVAEDYHQKYLDENPGGYCSHRKYW